MALVMLAVVGTAGCSDTTSARVLPSDGDSGRDASPRSADAGQGSDAGPRPGDDEPTDAAVPRNIIFVTSTQFTLDDLDTLGTEQTRTDRILSGADAACAREARRAGSLAPAGDYVAWLGSSAHPAISRLIRARGGTPAGWERVDGKPVMMHPGGHVFYPPELDQFGLAPEPFKLVVTGPPPGDTSTKFSCDDFTSSTGILGGGVSSHGQGWQVGQGASCTDAFFLYCLQTDHIALLPSLTEPPGAKLAFVTRGFVPSYGVAGADAQCSADAATAHFTGTFRAALAVDGAPAASRFHPNGTPYYRPDGVEIVAHDTDLFGASARWEAAIDVDATLTIYGVETVFLGASTLDGPPTDNCANWTAASGTENVDVLDGEGATLHVAFTRTCDMPAALMCLQD